MNKTLLFISFFGGVLCLIALCFFLDELSAFYQQKIPLDTLGHFIGFLLFSWLVHALLKIPLLTTAIIMILYGALTELGQSYLGYRNGELSDFFADATGLLAFVLLKLGYLLVCNLVAPKRPNL